MRNNLKLHLSTGLVSSYNIQPGNEVGLFWGTHTHIYLYLLSPDPHGEQRSVSHVRITFILRLHYYTYFVSVATF